MQTKFKRQQLVRILIDPDPEYVEYHNPEDESELKKMPIEKGMLGKINILLPNGQYHVAIFNPKDKEKEEIIAYCELSEDDIEAI